MAALNRLQAIPIMSHAQQTETNAAQARADFLAALRNTFTSPDGAVVLEWLRTAAGTRKPAFISTGPGPIDPYAAAVRDGRKAIVLEIEANLALAESGDPARPTAIAGPRARTQKP